jgi:hypothetical protein
MTILYDCATASSPRRARIFLAEKGVLHDTLQIDLRGDEQMGEARSDAALSQIGGPIMRWMPWVGRRSRHAGRRGGATPARITR